MKNLNDKVEEMGDALKETDKSTGSDKTKSDEKPSSDKN